MKIGITFDYNAKGIRNADKDLRKFGKTGDFAKAKIAALGVAFVALGKASLKAAADDARAQALMATTMKNLGWESQTEAVSKYIDELQMATGVVDDQLRPAFASLLRVMDDVGSSQALLNLSLDIAAGTGKDVQSVVNTLTKAIQGQRKGLVTLGTGLDAAALKTASMAEIVQILTERYQGSAGAAAESYAGKYDRMKIAMSEAAETLGTSFFDALSESNINVQQLGKAINSFAGAIGTVVGKIGSFFTTTINGWANVKRYFLNDPVFAGLLRLFGVQTGPRATGASTIGDYNLGRGKAKKTPEQLQNEQLLKLMKQIDAENKKRSAKESAKQRADAAQKKRQAALDKQSAELAMKYDTERASIAVAFAKTQSSDTKQRLVDLMAINTEQYAQNLGLKSMEDIYDLINKQLGLAVRQINDAAAAQRNWNSATAAMPFIGPTVPGAAPYVGLAKPGALGVYGPTVPTGDAITNTTPFIGQQVPGTINERAGIPAGPSVTVNINGPTIGSDVDQVVLDAVNRATRRGGLLRGSQAVL